MKHLVKTLFALLLMAVIGIIGMIIVERTQSSGATKVETHVSAEKETLRERITSFFSDVISRVNH